MPADPEQVERLFVEALARPVGEQAAFLEEVSRGDRELQAEVMRLLQAHYALTGFLPDTARQGPLAEKAYEEKPGDILDRFKLLERIGEGAFAIVWRAEQIEPVRREVALKILKAGMDTHEVVARFEAERQALALMDHPHIASVIDAGTTAYGRPYFVMELVRGMPLTAFCDANRTPATERLRLFIQVCHAVQHAHQKGIIHRDLKPSNILITLHDGVPVPKVIDFGIAKALGVTLTEKTFFTGFAQMIGTPVYMSPEQAELSGLDVDTRSDVYSLGVLLYELLTGTTPIEADELRQAAIDEIVRLIREREPARPSTHLTTVQMGERIAIASRRGMSVRELSSLLKGDLDWIVIKALEKDRTRRYDTVAGLAADLGRYLIHQPVEAHAPSMAYKLRKFGVRNRLAISVVAVITVAILGALVTSSWMWVREEAARREAEASEARSDRLLYSADMILASQALDGNDIGKVRRLLDRHRPAKGDTDLRGWEWRYLWAQARRQAANVVTDRDQRVHALDFTHDGTRAVVGYWDGRVELWRVADWTLERILEEARDEEVLGAVACSPSENVIFTTGELNEVRKHDLDTGESETVASLSEAYVRDMAFDAGGRQLVVVGRDQFSRIHSVPDALWIDIATGEVQVRHPVFGFDNHFGNARISPDLEFTYYNTGFYQKAKVICARLPGMEPVWEFSMEGDRGFSAMALSPDGTVLASAQGYNTTTIRLWDAATGRYLNRLEGHSAWVASLDFSPDGSLLASAGSDQTARIWNVATGRELAVLRAHGDSLQAVAFSPDGRTLLTGDKEGKVMAWDLQRMLAGSASQILPDDSRMLFWLPDSHCLLVESQARTWSIHDLDTGERRVFPFKRAHRSSENTLVSWDPDAPETFTLHRVSMEGHAPLATFETDRSLNFYFQYSEDSGVLAWSDDAGEVYVADLQDPETVRKYSTGMPGSYPVSIAQGGRYLMAFSFGNARVWVWDLKQNRSLGSFATSDDRYPGMFRILESLPTLITIPRAGPESVLVLDDLSGRNHSRIAFEPEGYVLDFAVNRDEALLATANDSGKVALYDLRARAKTKTLHGNILGAWSVAIHPAGDRLFTASQGHRGSILWDVETGQEMLRLDARDMMGYSGFSDDGEILLAWSYYRFGQAKFWRVPSWEEIEAVEDSGRHW